ncbi:MAG TPA: serine hydrolase domain-containing protein, partial [Blastocatellia bacterium]|nr:serine hydrolase domain-containing protein [Blastocatellia bacterium]
MLLKRFSNLILVVTVAATAIAPLSNVYSAPLASVRARADFKSDAPDQAARLAAIERAIDEKRKQLHIPGVSLVIVKDDKAIYSKGLGVKDVERNEAVTPDTLFAIGSNSKAFTALAAIVSADEGKMSLDDSPKKYLPYFKLQDPEADARVTIRDLLSHQSGLAGTDLAWYTGVLNREEVIRAACLAKPTAKLREKFQYQNVMYSAAGEAVARAQNSTWEDVIATRFFKPLGMKSSNTSVKQMQKSSDFAIGYEVSNNAPSRLPLRDLTNIAPAGAINSNARDMAEWLRFLLAGGVYNGKRLVSEKGFNEWITKQIAASGTTGYALGWAVADWRGHKVLMHTGGIDGFHSLVAWMPDQKLGFVMLTNVSESPIMGTALNAVWTNLVGGGTAPAETGQP